MKMYIKHQNDFKILTIRILILNQFPVFPTGLISFGFMCIISCSTAD